MGLVFIRLLQMTVLPYLVAIPLSRVVRRGDPEWLNYVNVRIDLKKNGTIDDLYRRWILGQEAKRGGPRWCVIRDFLGWVD